MPDKAQAQAQPNAPWIQCGRLVKVLAWLLALSWVIIAAEGVAMSALFPLKKLVPVVAEFESGGNNFVRVEAAGQKLRANAVLLSVLMRRYVVDRETVDRITEAQRYARVMAMSGQDVRTRFRTVYGDPKTGLYFRNGFKRRIEIVQDNDLGAGVHQVEFLTYDTQNGQPTKTGKDGKPVPADWTATIAYEYDDQAVSYNKRLLNPTGLIVTEYSLARRKS